MTNVAVIIVNWNLADETLACIHSLTQAGLALGNIIVVDNGSSDDSVQRLQAAVSGQIELIQSPQNLGFSGGNNLGIQRALDRGAEWVLLINNDTVVAPNFWAEMVAAIAHAPTCLILAPLILYHSEPTRIWSLGDRLIWGTMITRRLWQNQIVPPQLPAFVPVDFLNACCMLVNRRVFEGIGLLDDTFFMYAEDVDFCWRARQAHYQMGCWTAARIWHKVARSTGVYHPTRRYWQISNQIRVYRRYGRGYQLPLMWLFTLLRTAKLLLADLAHGRWALVRPTLGAWWTGWFGRNVDKTSKSHSPS